MVLGVREDRSTRYPDQQPTQPADGDRRDFEAEAENGRIPHEIEEGDTAIGLSKEFDYLFPDEFAIAYPEASDNLDQIRAGDKIDFLTPERIERVRQIKDIAGDTGTWGDLSEDAQNQIRGILAIDMMDGARGAALDEEDLTARLDERAGDFRTYLPDLEGLDPVIDETRDEVLAGVNEVMTPAMRAAIEKGLADPSNNEAWADFRTEAIRQMDAGIAAEANVQPDPETGLLRRTEEKVVRDYTGMLLELAPGDSDQLGAQLGTAADEILVQRPAREIIASYTQPEDTGDKVANFFNFFGDGKDKYLDHMLTTLDEKTAAGSDGQPMSPERVNAIIEACEDELRDGLAQGRHGGDDNRRVAEVFNRVAGRASTSLPGEDGGVRLLARLMIDEGLMDQPTSGHPHIVRDAFVTRFRDSVRDGEGVNLALAVASEYASRGDTANAERMLDAVREDSKTFFESTIETAENFESIFQKDARYAFHSLQGFMTPEEEEAFITRMQSELRGEELSGFNSFLLNRESNKDVYNQFHENRNGIVSTLTALENLPENLKTLDGYGELEGFHGETMEVLQSEQLLDDEEADDYQKGLQFATFGAEFSPAEAVGLSTEVKQWLGGQSDAFFEDLIGTFDRGQAGENVEDLPPAPPALLQLREEIGSDPTAAAAELRNNPEAALAFAQYLYTCQEAGNAPGREVRSALPLFAIRTTKDLVEELMEKASPYLRNAFTNTATPMPFRPMFANTPPGNETAAKQMLLDAKARTMGYEFNNFVRSNSATAPKFPRLFTAAQDWWYSPDRYLNSEGQPKITAKTGLYGHRWVGALPPLANTALNVWGVNSFWPEDMDKMNPFSGEFEFWSDEFVNGLWGPFFAATTAQQGSLAAATLTRTGFEAAGRTAPAWTNFSAANGGIRSMLLAKGIERVLLQPAMALLVANEFRKGDYAMAAAWTPGLIAAFMPAIPALAATSWAGPVAVGLWLVTGVSSFALASYRGVDGANRLEGPMGEGFEGAGFPEDKARALGNTTGRGESRYPLLRAASEKYFAMDAQSMFAAFRDEAMSAEELGYLVELTHHLDIEPDDEGNYPEISELDESDRYILAAMYRLLPENHRAGAPPPIFPDGELPKLWDGGLLPWDDAKWLSDDTLIPWDDQQLPDGSLPWKNGTYRDQPERVKEIVSYLYWRDEDR